MGIKSISLAATTITFLGLLPGANASIVNVAGVTSGNSTDYGDLSHIIDQSGLSSTYTSGVTDFSTFTSSVTHVNNSPVNAWATIGSTANIDFDFGAEVNITQFAFWGDNGSNTNNINEFSILISNDRTFATFTDLGTFNGPLPNANPVEAAMFDVTDGLGRYVRLQASNFGGSYVILGEVAFDDGAVNAVPVPAAFWLFGSGLLGLVAVARRKKSLLYKR